MSEVYVVIPVHNRLGHTIRCLESLRQQRFEQLTTILVDDGSTDGTSQAVHAQFPNVVILKGDGSLWWTGATNMGVSWVLDRCRPGDYVLTLNNDTTISPDYVAKLVDLAESVGTALVGSVCVDLRAPDTIVDGGPMIRWLTAKSWSLNGGKRLFDCRANGLCQTVPMFLPGRGTLIPEACFRELGLFNSRSLPHYAADYEFSRRAARSGYLLLMSYEASVSTDVESSGLSIRTEALSRTQFFRMFFSKRSPACLIYRWRFAWLSAPKALLPAFVVADTARVICGALRDQLRAS
ncbi:MAG: glycosyltransferase family 2 protein [Thermoleophilia bacterium]|nr:glycosyltransferase family 2 protein [Thermoleophilia bacterium]